MKRLIALLLVAVMAAGMSGCSFQIGFGRTVTQNASSEDIKSETSVSDIEDSTSETVSSQQDDYKPADYAVYGRQDESLKGDYIYVEGTAVEYFEN